MDSVTADSAEYVAVGALGHLVGLFGEMLGQREEEIVCLLLRHRPLIARSGWLA